MQEIAPEILAALKARFHFPIQSLTSHFTKEFNAQNFDVKRQVHQRFADERGVWMVHEEIEQDG